MIAETSGCMSYDKMERACRRTHNDGWEEAKSKLDLFWPRQHVIVPQDGQDAIAA